MNTELIKKDSLFNQDFAWIITTGALLFGYFYTRIKNDIKLLECKTKNNESSCKEIKYNINRLSLRVDTIPDKKEIDKVYSELTNNSKYINNIEINKDKYQAWSGIASEGDIELTILITKHKCTSNLLNQEWLSWNGKKNGSCIARDFYMGSFEPDFQWTIIHDEPCHGYVHQNITNGWDNIVSVKIHIKMKDWSSTKNYVTNTVSLSEAEEEQKIFNNILKIFHQRDSSDENSILWTHILVDADS